MMSRYTRLCGLVGLTLVIAMAFGSNVTILAKIAPDPHSTSMLAQSVLAPITVANAERVTQLAVVARDGLDAAWSPDSKVLAVGTEEGARLYTVNALEATPHLIKRQGCSSVAFSPDGTIVACGEGYYVYLYHAQSGARRMVLSALRDVISMVFSADGATLAVAYARDGKGSTVRLWDVKTGRVRLVPPPPDIDITTKLALNPQGTLVAVGGKNTGLHVWGMQLGKWLPIHFPPPQPDYPYSVAFSPDGSLLAYGAGLRLIHFWNVLPKEINYSVVLSSGSSNYAKDYSCSLAFSSDGTLLAAGDLEGNIHLWDVKNSQQKAVLSGHTGSVTSLAFSPDGTLLVSNASRIYNAISPCANGDKTVRLWAVGRGSK